MAAIERKTKRYPTDLTDEGMGADRAVAAQAWTAGAQAGG